MGLILLVGVLFGQFLLVESALENPLTQLYVVAVVVLVWDVVADVDLHQVLEQNEVIFETTPEQFYFLDNWADKLWTLKEEVQTLVVEQDNQDLLPLKLLLPSRDITSFFLSRLLQLSLGLFDQFLSQLSHLSAENGV